MLKVERPFGLRLRAAWHVLRGRPTLYAVEYRAPINYLGYDSDIYLIDCRIFKDFRASAMVKDDLTLEERFSAEMEPITKWKGLMPLKGE